MKTMIVIQHGEFHTTYRLMITVGNNPPIFVNPAEHAEIAIEENETITVSIEAPLTVPAPAPVDTVTGI